MKTEGLRQLRPQTILAATVGLSALPFLMAALFPSRLYVTMDIAQYLVFHNVAEFFSVMVSLSIFGIGWYTYDQSKDRHALFLSSAFLAIGLMDFMHTLSYAGMPAFITPNSANKSTQFWIAVRLYTAAVFLISAFIYQDSQGRYLSKRNLLAAASVVSALVFIGIVYFPASIPDTFREGSGLTPFKTVSEYLIMLMLAGASAAYWKRFLKTRDSVMIFYIAAFIICIFSELVFAIYKSVFDTFNVLGHLYKIAAFFLIYKGMFVASVRNPYIQLQQEIVERIHAEEELKQHREHLEELVTERTFELELKTQEAEHATLLSMEASRAKSAFLANMSHELRTPLNSIIGFSEILEDQLFGSLNEKQQEFIKDISGSGKHLLDLINDILDLSKVESGRMVLEPDEFLLSDALRASVSLLSEKAMKHNLKIDLDIHPEANIGIEADARKLKQIIVNLLSNAVKFTPDGGSVRVEARVISDVGAIQRVAQEEGRDSASPLLDRDFIEISVSDTGIGIKPENIPKLFHEFTQLGSDYTKTVEGTGLGLALSKKLVELHGGTIWVDSEFGKGSTFTFAIPARQSVKEA